MPGQYWLRTKKLGNKRLTKNVFLTDASSLLISFLLLLLWNGMPRPDSWQGSRLLSYEQAQKSPPTTIYTVYT